MITVPTERSTALSAGIDEVRVGPEGGTTVVVEVVEVELVVVVVEVDVVEVVVEEVVVELVVVVGGVVDVGDVVDVETVVPEGTMVDEVGELVVGDISAVSETGDVVDVEEVVEDEVLDGSEVKATEVDVLTTDSALGELCDELGHMAAAMTTMTSAAMKICTVPCTELPKRRFFI